MEIIAIKPTGFSSNCFILHSGGEAFVIDPSVSELRVMSILQENGLALKGILLTHGHFDHIWRAKELRELSGAPLMIHELDAEMLTDSTKNAYAFFTGNNFTVDEPDNLLHDGDVLTLGDKKIRVIHTPGHSRGSVCFDTDNLLVTGDTLFAEGFGRYDLHGGDLLSLKSSLSLLKKMADTEDKPIYCGHGERSGLRASTNRLKYYFDI